MKFVVAGITSLVLLLVFASSGRGDNAPPAPPALQSPPVAPHDQLKKILDEPIYNAWRLRQSGKAATNRPGLDELGDRISAAWDRFWKWLFPEKKPREINLGGSNSSASIFPAVLRLFAWAIAIAAVVFIAVLLFKAIGVSKQSPTSGRILSRQQIQNALDSGDALALGADEWLQQAQRLANEQNFRAVYRALYLALLSGLHTAGKIDHSRNRTNWMYVQHYRGPEDERVIFGDLTDLFDRVWYGRKEETGRNIGELQQTVASLAGVGGRP